MDELILRLESLTEALMNELETVDVDRVERFVDEREQIVRSIMEITLTPEMKALYAARVQRILSLDGVINNKLQELKQDSESSLQKLRDRRVQKNKYESVYVSESVFFDQKK